MPLRPACSFARRAVLGRCLSPPSLRPRAPGVGLALGAGRPRGMPPHPERCLRHSPFGGWGSSLPPPTWSPLTGSAHPQAAQWGGGSPCVRGAHHRHSQVPPVPSGTAVSHSPVCYRARSTRWVPMGFAHPRLTPCVCVCVICTFRGGSLCSVGLDAPFGSGLLMPLWDVGPLPSACVCVCVCVCVFVHLLP